VKHSEKALPAAAAVSAVTTLACCLPLGIAAGTAAAGLASVATDYRWWFIGASVAFLVIGAVQVIQQRRACATRGSLSTFVLAASASIVFLVIFFPQLVAAFLADWLP
jgi:hypothetical protein